MKLRLALTVSIVALTAPSAAGKDSDGDGLVDALEDYLGLPSRVAQQLTEIGTSPVRKQNEKQALVNAPDIVSIAAGHVGGQRLVFKTAFAGKPNFKNAVFILYLDLDNNAETGRDNPQHRGVDLMLTYSGKSVGASFFGPLFSQDRPTYRGSLEGNILWMSLDFPLHVSDGTAEFGFHLLSQRRAQGSRSDSTRHQVARLPLSSNRELRPLSNKPQLGKPLTHYRYHNDRVKLEKLSDKGLTIEEVAPARPVKFGRPRPPLPYTHSRKPRTRGTLRKESVPVELLEEAGVAREAARIRFGFPLPRGGLFNTADMRVLSPAAGRIPAQMTPIAFWPDSSLKWVLIEFATPLRSGQKLICRVELGSQVTRAVPASPLAASVDRDQITVLTGPLKAIINPRRFAGLDAVWVDRNRDGQWAGNEKVLASSALGVRMKDEQGELYTTANVPPKSVTIEEQGPERITLRIEGEYATGSGKRYMSYVSRLTFRRGSGLIEIAHTHVDTYLKTEFTDITSLEMPFQLSSNIRQGSLLSPNQKVPARPADWLPSGGTWSLVQWDDQTLAVTPASKTLPAQSLGMVRLEAGRPVLIGIQDFWQRWPKAISASEDRVVIGLLPEQPGPDFGRGLPHYLLFPFVEGKYRFKWGMSFTERVFIDAGGSMSLAELNAEINRPVVPVLPAAWYARTRAWGPLASPLKKQFAAWDKYAASGFRSYMSRKARQREYGYFNYGDWYGERGRNWGNNEYDLAHGLFMQFVRTGHRDYFRWALKAARHQADVDCVHAYPDPFYIGANHQHSIGHTGTWSQVPEHATWSHRYDGHTDARNGHTWSEGMLDAWYLAGEPRPMEAALGLGEHIAWAMSRNFKKLGTHERSAGWSLRAIMAIYQATNDPVYLEAAGRIAAVALREQKFNEGGAWPHLLPRDHAGGHSGARGNNLFLIGILLSGLKAYHEVTADPAAAKSIIAGANWVLKSWDSRKEGWPYSAGLNGEPFYKPTSGLNPLIIEGIAYAGRLSGDTRFIKVAESALDSFVRSGAPGFGKSLAQKMVFTGRTLAELQEWYTKHRQDRGENVLAGGKASLEKHVLRIPDATEHMVRAPDIKLFWLKLEQKRAKVSAVRTPHGAKPKKLKEGSIRFFDSIGKEVLHREFSTDLPWKFETDLSAARPGAQFKAVIKDDQRAFWSLFSPAADLVVKVAPGFSFAHIGEARFYFFVPAGTDKFEVRIVGVHEGPYGAAVLSPADKILALHQGVNPGQVQLPWAPKMPGQAAKHPERATLTIKPTKADTGQIWSLVLWASNNIACELKGVPPYLSLHRNSWFLP